MMMLYFCLNLLSVVCLISWLSIWLSLLCVRKVCIVICGFFCLSFLSVLVVEVLSVEVLMCCLFMFVIWLLLVMLLKLLEFDMLVDVNVSVIRVRNMSVRIMLMWEFIILWKNWSIGLFVCVLFGKMFVGIDVRF